MAMRFFLNRRQASDQSEVPRSGVLGSELSVISWLLIFILPANHTNLHKSDHTNNSCAFRVFSGQIPRTDSQHFFCPLKGAKSTLNRFTSIFLQNDSFPFQLWKMAKIHQQGQLTSCCVEIVDYLCTMFIGQLVHHLYLNNNFAGH